MSVRVTNPHGDHDRVINLIHRAADPEYIELFTSTLSKDEIIITFDDAFTLPELVCIAGITRSQEEARDNGFIGPVPKYWGESLIDCKGRNVRLYILGDSVGE